MNKMILFFILGLTTFMLGHCTSEMFFNGVTSEVQIKYDQVKPIFKARCYICHQPNAGRGDWMDYDQAFNKRNEIFRRVKSGNMPMGNVTHMTKSEREDVLTWVKQGARK